MLPYKMHGSLFALNLHLEQLGSAVGSIVIRTRNFFGRTSALRCTSTTAGKNNVLNLQLDSLDHSLCIFQCEHLLLK